MTTLQKVIKYLAIAFAIFLIVTIVSAVLGVLLVFTGISYVKDGVTNVVTEMSAVEVTDKQLGVIAEVKSDVKNLDIELAYTSLVIKTGSEFKVESSNSDITCEQNGDKLQIKEQQNNWFINDTGLSLIIYVPEGVEFGNVDINAGAGKVQIENLMAQKLSFKLGAGESIIQQLNVLKDCRIEGGAEKITISSGTINNLDLDMGIGESNVSVKLQGKSEINAGVGAVNVNLVGSEDDYRIKVDKGIGSIKINGVEATNGAVYGNGNNVVDIDGGIGSVKVEFRETI